MVTGSGGREKCVQQRIAGEIYGKIVVQIGGEEIQTRVLEEARKELTAMEEESIR